MIQRREHLGFALEPREPIGIAHEGLGQHLDRDIAIQPRIARAIHLAHTARAEQRQDFICAETSCRAPGTCVSGANYSVSAAQDIDIIAPSWEGSR